MKQLTCEMCGSNDLLKEEGIFVCQTCGCKYSVEEAKKMMVEGTVDVTGSTVKVDNSSRLKNLYQIARQARDNNDYENAAKYYDMIMQEDPNSWEATFYNVYYRAAQTKIAYITSAADSIRDCLATVFSLITVYVEDLSERKLAVVEIALHVTAIGTMLESSARSTFKESWDSVWLKYDDSTSVALEYFQEYHSRNEAVYTLLWTLADNIEIFNTTDEAMCNLAVEAYKNGLQHFADDYLIFDEYVHNKTLMDDKIGSKIRKYEPDYVFPTPNTNGYPNWIKNQVDENYRKLANTTSGTTTNSSSASSNSGGCYVATAVYGSYDCPEVWTLRRYRDNQLAKTWYGRLFVYTYYAISPTIVKWFGDTEWFKKMWKGKLDKMVSDLQSEGVESSPYEDRNWR
ncbi:MAG: hypothetical protein K2H13_08585 [Eubacterium sp.]|nr:hypothetical protein [Eubacterium sp.]MDE6767131.1 hypothetical protein [Eubacterium sp.]